MTVKNTQVLQSNGEASGHTEEDLMSFSLVVKNCLVGAGESLIPKGVGLRPLPKVKDRLSLREA